MPITNRSQAKEGGFAQVREVLTEFEGDVVAQNARGEKTGFGMWGAGTNPDGTPKAPKEFFQIVCVNVVPVASTEPLSMDISEGWTTRVNCSDYKGSFWIDAFLKSADDNKVQIPDGLIGNRVRFKKFVLEAKDKNGNPKPEFNSTGFIITAVLGKSAAPVNPTMAAPTQTVASSPQTTVAPPPAQTASDDPMVVALELAVGKTEQQFRTAVSVHPLFVGTPLLGLAKAGAITQTLVNDGKLKLVALGNKQVYAKP